MVVVLWIGGIASQLAGVKPWAAVGVWLVLAIAAAFVINQVKKQPSEGKPLPQ
jgi:membrane protein implicated in regulation of membrane protease activity